MAKLECVACDLDGSLLNADKRIHPADKETIKKLKALGIPFFICTGRPADFARQIMAEVGHEYPVCACNGAYALDMDTHELVYMVEPISTELVLEMQAYLEESKLSYFVYTTEGPLFDRPDSKRTLHWKDQWEKNFEPQNRFEFHYVDDPGVDLTKMNVIKFLVPYVEDEVKDRLNERFNKDGTLEIMWSEQSVLDINTAGTNKGYGLQRLSEIYNFSLENTLVLGDNFNDLPMLEICGLPVVPENGEEDLKAMAKFVTTHHNDAPLTHAIQHFFPELLEQA